MKATLEQVTMAVAKNLSAYGPIEIDEVHYGGAAEGHVHIGGSDEDGRRFEATVRVTDFE